MKTENEYDFYKYKASLVPNSYEIVCKNGDLHTISAHEAVVDPGNTSLKLILYSMALVDKVEIIGGTKNRQVNIEPEERPVAELVAAFLPGEWLSVVNLSNRPGLDNRTKVTSINMD